ncbi:MAG: NAD(P)H-dependent oxidoreductase subunit E [Candidatus Omnitrophica bacterium]|nr:NAD(P)H-dependent oxidoreductase subunit E [Candidatus Omnitrophota bacterium]MCM8828189.1 NAD(P)H-dependent oxidoreductase subunit E [Candidatus Omnitrophota bacterium]
MREKEYLFNNANKIDEILVKHGMNRSRIVAIMQDIQNEFGYLPEKNLKYISMKLQTPLSQIYSIATFYRAFSLKPRGKHLVTVCLGTACHVRGGARIVESIQKMFDVKPGEKTKDGLLSLETVNCLGACALGPVVVVDGKYHGHITISRLERIVKGILNENKK